MEKDEFKIRLLAILVVFVILIPIIIATLNSCYSVKYINPQLPEYEIEKIERPTVENQTEDVVKVMRYAMKKEEQLKSFETFYNNLREKFK